MKIEEFLKSLPNNIISGDNVQLPEYSFRRIFKFLDLNEKDIFYHLGCGDGKGIAIASEEFNVKKAVGIENMNRINQGGGGAVSINFTGNVMSQDFIEDEAIPMIKEAIRRGADIGVA